MDSALKALAVALICVGSAVAYTDAALKDQIVNLPGAEGLSITFNQFSGYLDINGASSATGKHMHYW